jgi:ABC-type bacteriocin/lantibiotic exporter with double-glycine peptidase domain
MVPRSTTSLDIVRSGISVQLQDASFGWTPLNEAQNIKVNTTIPTGSLTIIVGPVGCGKSTFLKALLGETQSLEGIVSLSSSDIAFCDQTPWMINGTIRENIIAETRQFDEAWYTTVINACVLLQDIQQYPLGDATMVGSKGVKLSGGQKQRVVSFVTYREIVASTLTTIGTRSSTILSETNSHL